MKRTKITVEKEFTFTGHQDCIYAIEDLPGTSSFFTSGADGLVVKWNLQQPDKGELVAKVTNTVYALCYLPAFNTLVVGQNFEGIHLIDLSSNQQIRSLKINDQPIFDIKFHDQTLFIATGKGWLYMVDYASFSIKVQLNLSESSLRCLAVLPEKKEVAAGFSDHQIRVINYETQEIKTLTGHQNSVFSLAYSPDHRFLLSGSRDAQLMIWGTNAYDLKEPIVAHMYTINHIAFRPDGHYFATCSKDKSVKIWDGKWFVLLKVIDRARHAGHGTSVNKLLWKGENRLISCSDDRSISIWKLQFDQPLPNSEKYTT